MESYQFAWMLYILGVLAGGLATWLLFRRFGRACGHFFAVTALTLLLTPYAVDGQAMIMAPALFILVMETLVNGFETVKPIALLLAGVWLIGLVVSLFYQLLTRNAFWVRAHPIAEQAERQSLPEVAKRSVRKQPHEYNKHLTQAENRARHELLSGEVPIRAER